VRWGALPGTGAASRATRRTAARSRPARRGSPGPLGTEHERSPAMIRFTLRYVRYALSGLNAIAFLIAAN
jgi:hypothetical protein